MNSFLGDLSDASAESYSLVMWYVTQQTQMDSDTHARDTSTPRNTRCTRKHTCGFEKLVDLVL